MRPIEETLRERFSVAIGLAFGTENVIDPLIKSADPKHADYQSNVAMPLSKKVSLKPRDVAATIIKHLAINDICEPLTDQSIAGPGFINLRLRHDYLANALARAFPLTPSPRAGVDRTATPQTIVVDYSGPNIAKQMHVGHLRSTNIGDCFARTLQFLGHNVIRQNHLGDFGTQFGMLIAFLRDQNLTQTSFTIADLDAYYKQSTARFKSDPAFAQIARQTVVQLQAGDPSAVELWNAMRTATRQHYTAVYQQLGITLTESAERGESFYGPRLAPMVERLKAALEFGGEGASVSARSGQPANAWQFDTDDLSPDDAAEAQGAVGSKDAIERLDEATAPHKPELITKSFAAISNGALCVFLPGFITQSGEPLPLIIQKTNGGFGYAATDLTALYFRIQENKSAPADQKPLTADWHADRIIIVTDARQAQHFNMVFDAARAAKWDLNPLTGQPVPLDHASFGSILGEDNKPFKTRSGGSVQLQDLLNEAIDRAAQAVAAKNPDLSPEIQKQVAQAVGIGALKYADLRQDRNSDYVFAWDRMLSFEGNTGPYLQYAYTRVQSIFRKSNLSADSLINTPITLDHPQELALAKKLLQFGSVVESVARDLKPHYLTAYLFDLAVLFSSFYENCPVLKAPTEAQKLSRLALSRMVAQTLHLALTDLLGIQTLEEM